MELFRRQLVEKDPELWDPEKHGARGGGSRHVEDGVMESQGNSLCQPQLNRGRVACNGAVEALWRGVGVASKWGHGVGVKGRIAGAWEVRRLTVQREENRT